MPKNLIVLLFISIFSVQGHSKNVQSIDDYNSALPVWGTTWSPGSDATNGYYPTFYTGFAMRSQSPERIHVRLARGNQTRVTVILDDQNLQDYLFDLVKRYEFYKQVTQPLRGMNSAPILLASARKAKVTPHLEYFNNIIESPTYGILDFVQKARQGTVSEQEIYAKSVRTLKELNPGRVFLLNIPLIPEFQKWKQYVREGRIQAALFTKKPETAIQAINSLLWGRINYTERPSAEILSTLSQTANLALDDAKEIYFLASAVKLFKLVAGDKYNFRVLDNSGQWQPALQCDGPKHCYLSYPEFTAVYPTGTLEETTRDEHGNRINRFATPGLWKFLSRSGRHDVDNIRSEPYYGWIPKMDYEAAGNGFHNPAVRFYGVKKDVKAALGIPGDHKTLWSVKRGGVSHGCARLPTGHVWELRHIFPVENEKMTQVYHFGNASQDFDIYDIDGDGQLEVMGVQYFISYGLQGSSGLARREGADLQINEDRKYDFYLNLYGAQGVFTLLNDGTYQIHNPKASMPSYLDLRRKTIKADWKFQGSFPLYEQSYEKDKVQFYLPVNSSGRAIEANSSAYKDIIRLMGRVRGCAPQSDKNQCGEAAFNQEARDIFYRVYNTEIF